MKQNPRIYLDATSACQSPLNTGVKRMQRGLHQWLATRDDYVPVYWQSALRGYRQLQEEDLATLELRQKERPRGLALYDAFLIGAFSDWMQIRRDRSLLLNLENGSPNEILLVPDLLWDNRSKFFCRTGNQGHRIKRVGIFHDAIGLRRPSQSRIDRILCARGVRALAAFDLVFCISREAQADLHYYWKKFGLKAAPTHVAPWPNPLPGNRPQKRANFAAKKILYIARLEAHKNHLLLLKVCEQLWANGLKFDLQLIGCNAYPYYSWRVRNRVRQLAARGRPVTLQAQVSEAELNDAYQSCSFTAFPSLLEGFGLPIIESLWHGRPVVCGGNGALGETAAGGGCEIVNTASVENMARGLRLLLTDEAAYLRRHEEAWQRSFLSWADYWRSIEETMNVLLPAANR